MGEKIRILFREQGITTASILTPFGMAIDVLVEAVLSGGSAPQTTPNNPDLSGEGETVKDWVKNKLKVLTSLLGKLTSKAVVELPGIIGSIISWILTRAKEVIGWLSQTCGP